TASDKRSRIRNGALVETLEADRARRWHRRFGHLVALPGLRRHLAAAWAMWEQARLGEDFDVAETCDYPLLFLPPALDGVLPLVTQCHGSMGQIARHDPMIGEGIQSVVIQALEGAVLAGVDTIQTLSSSNAAAWRDETHRNVDMIRPAWAGAISHIEREIRNRGLVVGRVQRWKGPHVLCAAMKFLTNQTVKMDWVGSDTTWESPTRSSLTHLSLAYPDVWGPKIVHHYPVSATEVRRRQANALFNLVPSTWDVFNFTAVEAMASGRPVIISNAAGASEL